MRPFATYVARNVVCVSVGHMYVLCWNGWTDRDAVWLSLALATMYYVTVGVDIPTAMGNFGGCPATEKHWESAVTYAAKGSFDPQ